MSAPEEIWLPLVDEPIGAVVRQIEEEHPEVAALVSSPRRLLAFRTFAYLRVGVLLGELLVEHEDAPGDDTWVESLFADPRHREAIEREVRAVAQELAADPRYADDETLGPDEAARARFRDFAQRELGAPSRRPG